MRDLGQSPGYFSTGLQDFLPASPASHAIQDAVLHKRSTDWNSIDVSRWSSSKVDCFDWSLVVLCTCWRNGLQCTERNNSVPQPWVNEMRCLNRLKKHQLRKYFVRFLKRTWVGYVAVIYVCLIKLRCGLTCFLLLSDYYYIISIIIKFITSTQHHYNKESNIIR